MSYQNWTRHAWIISLLLLHLVVELENFPHEEPLCQKKKNEGAFAKNY